MLEIVRETTSVLLLITLETCKFSLCGDKELICKEEKNERIAFKQGRLVIFWATCR